MKPNTTTVILESTPTALFKVLKFEGLATSGAEAKMLIASGLVKVNGRVEKQKRKKITAGDIIEFNGYTLLTSK